MGLLDFIFNKKITIPEKYLGFPKYQGTPASRAKETETDKYFRLTMMYKGEPQYSYIDTIEDLGYKRGSDVRYDKDNTYIIIEKISNKTKIAYHIKK